MVGTAWIDRSRVSGILTSVSSGTLEEEGEKEEVGSGCAARRIRAGKRRRRDQYVLEMTAAS